MAVGSLLDRLAAHFDGIAVDADSNGGKVLGSLLPQDPAAVLSGIADVSALTLALTPNGLSVGAASANDPLILQLPAAPSAFEVKQPGGPHTTVTVEITIVAPRVKLPKLTPAKLGPDEMLIADVGDRVELVLPRLLLVVTATPGNPDARATLAPSHANGGGLEITMQPPDALFGGSDVLGLHFSSGVIDFDPSGGIQFRLTSLDIYVAPPAMPALAMRGGATNLIIAPGKGISGPFKLAAAGPAPKRPDFLHNIEARLVLDRNEVRLLEITGQVQLSKAMSSWLADADDAIAAATELDYRVGLILGQDGWEADVRLSASGGRDYLWRSKAGPHAHRGSGRDVLGAYAVFAPLLGQLLPEGASGYVKLALVGGAATSLAESKWVRTEQLTVWSAEYKLGSLNGAQSAMLFFEVETEFNITANIGAFELLSTRKPIRVRQKSVGLKLDFGDAAAPNLTPVFDPGQGFSLDLSDPGTFKLPEPLDEFLQPDAARVARENPVVFEVDLVTKADLGVLKIDKASIRIPLDGSLDPSLTGLGARLDLGMISGGGYIKLDAGDGVSGGFDLAIGKPLGLRVNADLSIGRQNGVTGVRIGLGVEWPVPIPLANSGLGLFGILGLLAINEERNMTGFPTALEWYDDAKADPGGPSAKWMIGPGAWAFGVGAVIGTIEGGFLFHAKGMVVIELPGPRILLLMKADIMSERPDVETTQQGALTAVVEISPSVVSIGIIARYEILFLLEIQVPASAVFPTPPDLDQWRFDMGSLIDERYVSVRFMQSIRADGYFMVHGGGITKPGIVDLPGIAVAAGINAALTWGPVPIGLYIRVAVVANIGLSFKPKFLIGQLSLSGELHLFIVSIGASATAKFIVGDGPGFYVFAEVSGSVDFFFFEVSGSVELSLGSEPQPPKPPQLIRELSLYARSHALLPGSGADGAIDGAFRKGTEVPIDAILVLEFEMRAVVETSAKFLGTPIVSWLDKNDHVQRGQRLYRYRLSAVTLVAAGHDHPVQGTDTPVVWWDDHHLTATGTDTAVQLALLCGVPNPSPNAVIDTQTRDDWIKQHWGSVCQKVADPRGILSTFAHSPVGSSTRGWILHGLLFPVRNGELCSKTPSTRLKITEPWRSHSAADQLLDVVPAAVLQIPGTTTRILRSPTTGPKLQPLPFADTLLGGVVLPDLEDLADAIALDPGPLGRIRGVIYQAASSGDMTLRLRDANGSRIRDIRLLDHAHLIFTAADLPPEWQDVESGWAQAVIESGTPLNFPTHERQWFFDIEDLEGASTVEIGRVHSHPSERPDPPWYLFAVEVVTEAEYRRAKFDHQSQGTAIGVIEGMLTGDDGKRALLHPATDYTVTATYQVDYADLDDDGAFKWENGNSDLTQTFQFKTANAPPDRLDGLVLATTPSADEQFVFCADPIRIVFSSRETRRLYAAYGHALQARVRAASGNHPTPPGADLKIDALSMQPTPWPNLALSPFDFALGNALQDLPCVNTDNRAERHDVVTLALPLAPLTNYMLDLNTDKWPNPTRPLLRRNFSTSQYPDIAAFAVDINHPDHLHHRFIENSAQLTSPMEEISDFAFDAMLRAAHWGDLRRTKTPKATVIWSGAQPKALLLETGEPHWRTRQVPVQAATTGEVTLQPHQWLALDRSVSGGLATGFVRSTEGSRTLIMLANARGQTLQIALKRFNSIAVEGNANPASQMLSFAIGVPPWEASP